MFDIPFDEEHYSWFRENENSVRVNDYNMCFTNQKALEYIKKRAKVLAEELPGNTNRYFIWMDDVGGDAFCHCENCSKLSWSDQYLTWCNMVLTGLLEVNPRAELCYIAYQKTIIPPKTVKPLDGIFLEFAPIHRDSFIEISNTNCKANKEEISGVRDLIEFFGKEKSQVLEYWIDNTRFSEFIEPYRKMQFDSEIMRRDMEFYKELGFRNFTSFACAIDLEYSKRYGDFDLSDYCKIINS